MVKQTLALVALCVVTTSCSDRQSSPVRPSVTSPSLSVTAQLADQGATIVISPAAAAAGVEWRCLANVGGGIFSMGGDAGCPAFVMSRSHALNSAGLSAPGAPTSLGQAVIGSDVSLGWQAPSSGDAPTSYLIEVGSTPNFTSFLITPVETTERTFTALNAPAGTYYVRVRAKNGAGAGPATSEVTVKVGGTTTPCNTPPNSPTGFASTTTDLGAKVTFTWNAPSGGCAPTSYLLDYGTSPGSFPNTLDTGNTSTTFTYNGVPAGLYYLQIRAKGPAGASSPSSSISFTSGSPAPTPKPTVPCVQCGIDYDNAIAACRVLLDQNKLFEWIACNDAAGKAADACKKICK